MGILLGLPILICGFIGAGSRTPTLIGRMIAWWER